MTTKSLYSKYEALNAAGEELDSEIAMALFPIIEKYTARGYPLRQIQSVIALYVSYLTSEMILRATMKIRKAERSQHERP